MSLGNPGAANRAGIRRGRAAFRTTKECIAIMVPMTVNGNKCRCALVDRRSFMKMKITFSQALLLLYPPVGSSAALSGLQTHSKPQNPLHEDIYNPRSYR
jgi:hypothetical protein